MARSVPARAPRTPASQAASLASIAATLAAGFRERQSTAIYPQ